MNEFEQDEESMQHPESEPDSAAASDTIIADTIISDGDAIVQESIPAKPEAAVIQPSHNGKSPRRNGNARKNGNREGQASRPKVVRRPGVFRRIVFISWSGEREPASELLWAEAVIDGEWVIIEKLEKVRTRKEVLERILEMESGLVALDFNFSYPAAFLEMLSASEHIADWQSMVKTIREDLKKNVDDGARLWVERLGRYRESYLDSETPRTPAKPSRRPNDRGWLSQQSDIHPRKLGPHEQQSLAERFRRTDLPLISLAGRNTMSTIQIGYNRLTERYEFNGNSRGKDALLGMAMLSQLLEANRDDLSIWPMMELKKLTVVETLPWLFTEGKRLEPNALASMLANYEDVGWHIPDEIQKNAAKNTKVQHALLTLLGMLKTEQRLLRNRFPIRFYSPSIFRDPQVQLEGWTYGMNYRVHQDGNDAKDHVSGEEHVDTIAIEASSPREAIAKTQTT
jgi:hypothetical protein